MKPVDLRHDLAQMVDLQMHLLGDLRVRPDGAPAWPSSCAVASAISRPLLAQVARAPVGIAQAVQDGAANAELREGLELGVLGAIEGPAGFQQADHARIHKVFQLNMLRKPFANSRGNVVDL